MLKIGDPAPDFALDAADGERVTLDSLLAGGDVILYFYPADFSPVCTREACVFRDRFPDSIDLGVQIVGISPQSADSHRRFADMHRLPFPLLSDPRKTMIRAYGADGPFGFGVSRVTYLIDSSKTVKRRAHSEFFVGTHMDLVDAVLAEHRNT